MKHLLKLLDHSADEIYELLELAGKLKFELKSGIAHPVLQGKTLGMIFEKASTRTRVSFEVGMKQLGGQGLFLSSNDLQIGRGEPVEDTARVLSRYLDGIMIRTFKQETVETLATYGSIPVINGLTDMYHPCQILADLLTIKEYKKNLEGLTACFIGDGGNNMANSLAVGCLKTGMTFNIAAPDDVRPAKEVLDFAEGFKGKLNFFSDPHAAAKDADVLLTDVWASMGQESETPERQLKFSAYQINEQLMKNAKPDAMVLHCLPAHRGEEITAETFEKHAAEIFDEAENRLHAQKAVMVTLMSK